jgi:two-component system chemotaxis sensor kinase CheA
MENIRAFEIFHLLQEKVSALTYEPADIMENQDTAEIIIANGFKMDFYSDQRINTIREMLGDTMFLKELVVQKNPKREPTTSNTTTDKKQIALQEKVEAHNNINQIATQATIKQSMISVSADKLDQLMDLMEELVISETMVLQNSQFKTLKSQRLQKEAKQLGKITNELRDIVMAIRMVPLSITFQKMNRLVRDMGKKLEKKVTLKLSGENTEVDKNIIDKIADPLMHIIRNSVDHGIESVQERVLTDKDEMGTVYLSAENIGSSVIITVRDDGKGLDRDGILAKAREKGLLDKAEAELTDEEIFAFIFHPGFSTNKNVTEFSGRGVGMDVVNKNIKALNGTVSVNSVKGEGTTMTIKLPLTIAIIDGMLVRVGDTVYTIPTISIKECFKTMPENVIKDRYDNEMVIIRNQCYQFIRLDQAFNTKNKLEKLEDGIVVMIEHEDKAVCLFAEALIGRQQIVVKALPEYIKNAKGIAGCTLLGDGSVSLIIDIPTFIK